MQAEALAHNRLGHDPLDFGRHLGWSSATLRTRLLSNHLLCQRLIATARSRQVKASDATSMRMAWHELPSDGRVQTRVPTTV